MNRHAGTPNKIRAKDTMSLDYNPICNIGSRIDRMDGWMDADESNLLLIAAGVERYILTSSSYGVEIKYVCMYVWSSHIAEYGSNG